MAEALIDEGGEETRVPGENPTDDELQKIRTVYLKIINWSFLPLLALVWQDSGHILYGELASGRLTKGRPQLRYKDVCKRDMTALDINTEPWEDLAADRMMWRSTLNQHLKSEKEKLGNAV